VAAKPELHSALDPKKNGDLILVRNRVANEPIADAV
jgi:hypothetical protein